MSKEQNNFQQLMEEESKFHPQLPPETEQGVMGSTRVVRFMSDVVELYLPRVFDMFVVLFGGSSSAEEAKGQQRQSGDSSDEAGHR